MGDSYYFKGVCWLRSGFGDIEFNGKTEDGNAFAICYRQGEKYKFSANNSQVLVCFDDKKSWYMPFSYGDFGRLFEDRLQR